MRVLFLESGPIWSRTLPSGFRDAGHDVMISGQLTKTNIPRMISEFYPDLVLSVGWGLEHTLKKQAWIRKYVGKAGVPLVYWAVEDSAFSESFTIPLIRRMKPNFIFTICPEKVNHYKKLRFKAAHMDFGYEPSMHFPIHVKEHTHSIVVVANAYPDVLRKFPNHYRHTALQTLIRPLVEKNIRIDFWGEDWDKMKRILKIKIPDGWLHGPLPYQEANRVYSAADIVIGLQNYRHILTQRTFEILGSGGFLLTLDTPGVRTLFTSKKHLITSSSPKETISLVNQFLELPKKRKEISETARSFISSRHSYRQRAVYMLDTLIREGILNNNHKQITDKIGSIIFYQDAEYQKYLLYHVEKGDTLWKISKQFGVPVHTIKELNGLKSDIIEIGRILRLQKKAP